MTGRPPYESANELWGSAAELLRSQVSDGVWQSTFAQVSPLELTTDTFTLSLPNGIIRDRLNGRYRPLVEDAVNEAAGFELRPSSSSWSRATLFEQTDHRPDRRMTRHR